MRNSDYVKNYAGKIDGQPCYKRMVEDREQNKAAIFFNPVVAYGGVTMADIYVDGTFKVTPLECLEQVLIIFRVIDNKVCTS